MPRPLTARRRCTSRTREAEERKPDGLPSASSATATKQNAVRVAVGHGLLQLRFIKVFGRTTRAKLRGAKVDGIGAVKKGGLHFFIVARGREKLGLFYFKIHNNSPYMNFMSIFFHFNYIPKSTACKEEYKNLHS